MSSRASILLIDTAMYALETTDALLEEFADVSVEARPEVAKCSTASRKFDSMDCRIPYFTLAGARPRIVQFSEVASCCHDIEPELVG